MENPDTKKENNAVEHRLDGLGNLWNQFAQNDQPRLLRWRVPGDDIKMIRLFFNLQDRGVGQIPDRFILFRNPFEDPSRYGFDLAKSFEVNYEQVRDDLAKQDLPAQWSCPKPLEGETGIEMLIRTCASFHEYYDNYMERVAVVLTPTMLCSKTKWVAWLQSLLESDIPAQIRFTVIDCVEAPLLDDLCDQMPDQAVTACPELDMPGAVEEIFNKAPNTGPGSTFRRLFVQLMNAISKQDLAKAQQSAKTALAFAQKQGWPQLQVVVNLALGTAYIADDQADQALATYQQAQQTAQQAQDAGDPVASKLVVQSLFAQCTALLTQKKYAPAAQIYEQIAPLTQAQDDLIMTLEAWRMAAYCHEKTRHWDDAWRCGHLALDTGEQMDTDAREASTLPYAGQALLRVTQQHAYRDLSQQVEERMVSLLGPEWAQPLEPEPANA